jgi:hypothetical protein
MLLIVICGERVLSWKGEKKGKERTDLEIKHLSLDFDVDLARQVTVGDGESDISNGPYLSVSIGRSYRQSRAREK